jgi:hypothetical protein
LYSLITLINTVKIMILSRYRYRSVTVPLPSRYRPVTIFCKRYPLMYKSIPYINDYKRSINGFKPWQRSGTVRNGEGRWTVRDGQERWGTVRDGEGRWGTGRDGGRWGTGRDGGRWGTVRDYSVTMMDGVSPWVTMIWKW